jgi:hypothetical protein
MTKNVTVLYIGSGQIIANTSQNKKPAVLGRFSFVGKSNPTG